MKLTFKPIDDNAKQGKTVLLADFKCLNGNGHPTIKDACFRHGGWADVPSNFSPTHYCEIDVEVKE